VLNRSFYLAAGLLLAALCWGETWPQPARAQTPAGPDALKSEIYFGLRAADGKVADAQAWERFVTEVVPRFPEGLTVIEASGRSSASPADLNPTRILVVVHAASDDAQSRLREIKAEYRSRFAGMGIFHTDQPVRVHRGD
jgi:hypothetical protein